MLGGFAFIFFFVAWPIGLIFLCVAAIMTEKRCIACHEATLFVPENSPRGRLLLDEARSTQYDKAR